MVSLQIQQVYFSYLDGLVLHNINLFIDAGIMTKSGDVYSINLNDIKVDKLLATGKVNQKFNIIVNEASDSAVKKISEAGGKVVILKKTESVKKESSKEE